jgi:hypothetical protein
MNPAPFCLFATLYHSATAALNEQTKKLCLGWEMNLRSFAYSFIFKHSTAEPQQLSNESMSLFRLGWEVNPGSSFIFTLLLLSYSSSSMNK